jgi:hypothetical protein
VYIQPINTLPVLYGVVFIKSPQHKFSDPKARWVFQHAFGHHFLRCTASPVFAMLAGAVFIKCFVAVEVFVTATALVS